MLTRGKRQGQLLKFLMTMVIALGLTLGGFQGKKANILGYFTSQAVTAQSLRPEQVAILVYQSLPYLPKENQYLSHETGEIATENTLISRLIRYHQDLKQRPTRFRLDWKLTLADYLGANEAVNPDRYPGRTSLKTNPAENDIKAIRNLNRRQREELVDLLASIYNPKKEEVQTPNNSSKPTTKPTPTPTPNKPTLSKPGDAQLLLP